MSAAPVTPVSCDRAPARSATAVRDALVLTGKPWNRPAARLAAPMPIISWLPCTSWPVRPANDDDVEIVSASETSAIARAPASERAEVRPAGPRGRSAAGSPCGSTPIRLTPRSPSSEDGADDDGQHHHDEDAGHLGQPALQARGSPRCRRARPRPRPGRRPPARAPARKPTNSPISPSASTENPNSLGSWPTRMVSGQPVHVADHGRLGEQVGDEAEPARCRPRS